MRSKRTLRFALGAIAAIAITGVAYAYWTGTGSGTGTGTVGTSSTVTITGTVAPGIAPGTSRPVSFTAENADTAAVQVTTVHLDGVSVDAGHSGCTVDDLSMANVTENHEVPAGATAEVLPEDGSLVYANTAVNQDACKGATLTLSLTSS